MQNLTLKNPLKHHMATINFSFNDLYDKTTEWLEQKKFMWTKHIKLNFHKNLIYYEKNHNLYAYNVHKMS